MTGASENHKVQYNPRTVHKPPEEFQRLVFPFIERCKNSLNALDAYYPRRTACDFLGLMERVITVLLQYVSQLINIGQTHILFDFEVFKTDLFLKYKENMGTLFITGVNPVSQSLKDVLREILIQITNLISDVNGYQKTSMDFLCSNFFKSMIMLLL